MNDAQNRTFVLVHGAWRGGWLDADGRISARGNGRVNSSLAKPGLVLQPEQPVEGQERGVGDYGSAKLLASSVGRSWSGLAAELRSHSGVIAKRNPSPDTEICVDVHGGASIVTLRRNGITDRTVSERGTIWLCPAGGPEGVVEMSDPLPAILHIYLPPSQFSPKSLGEGSKPSAAASLRFESSFQDSLVAEMAYAITSELQRETSVGSLLDSFPNETLHGRVERIAPASGSQFALLPPDNATGNFTKVVQRIPVRIALDKGQPLLERLLPGMSVVTRIHTDAAAAHGGN